MGRKLKVPALAALLAAFGLVMSGCGFSLYNVPLPGGADLGNHPYQVTAQFQDVLDLVPQAAVKVNDVAVGKVESINLPPNGWIANVVMQVNGDVKLPANASAWLEQSSLLGEKYVSLVGPTDGSAAGTLSNNAVIPVERTNRNPEVEEVLGALSLLLNGGGIDQIHTIDLQLNDAFAGNEGAIRSELSGLTTFIANADAHKQDIANAIDGVNRLSGTLAARDQQIGATLDSVPAGLQILAQQRGELVTMLNALNNLSGVAVNTINQSKDDMVADFNALAPTLRQLAAAGAALPQSLQVLLTYPFTDAVTGDIRGDYLNAFATLTGDGSTVIPASASGSNISGSPLVSTDQGGN
ncbi:MAG TPA: MCE family protein [Pseudonocardiaceae bacterium]|nr:MCE family protein [Pseudonocardiaceae bacterium]